MPGTSSTLIGLWALISRSKVTCPLGGSAGDEGAIVAVIAAMACTLASALLVCDSARIYCRGNRQARCTDFKSSI